MDLVRKYIEENNLNTKSKEFSRRDEDKFRRYHLMKYLRRNHNLTQTAAFFDMNHATVIHGLKMYDNLKDYEDFRIVTEEVRFLFPLDDSSKGVCRSEFEVLSLLTLEKQANKVLNKASFLD